jgi:hypothetical protein
VKVFFTDGYKGTGVNGLAGRRGVFGRHGRF